MSDSNKYQDLLLFYVLSFLVDTQPDTHEVDRSEIRTQILLATASSALKGRQSFTHMLTEVRLQRYKPKSIKVASKTRLNIINAVLRCCFLLVSTTLLQEISERLQQLYFNCFQPWSLVWVSQFYSSVLLASLMFSFLMGSLVFSENKADVEAPAFPMENAAVSAHSKCLNKQGGRGQEE